MPDQSQTLTQLPVPASHRSTRLFAGVIFEALETANHGLIRRMSVRI